MQALSENGRLDAPAERNAPIGVFDSGVGGLTVVREIMRQIPEEPIVYFGDTARVPYGGKSRETLLEADYSLFENAACEGDCRRVQYGERICARRDTARVGFADYRRGAARRAGGGRSD